MLREARSQHPPRSPRFSVCRAGFGPGVTRLGTLNWLQMLLGSGLTLLSLILSAAVRGHVARLSETQPDEHDSLLWRALR